jgi:outer membrane protein assembly factor BamD (BamD/ComL family)
MPEAERAVYVKKVLKKLRKEKGLKGGDEEGSYNTSTGEPQKADLFGDNKGEWYFLNNGLKSKGFTEFKSKWGKRANVDNWSRQSALDKMSATRSKKVSDMTSEVDDVGTVSDVKKAGAKKDGSTEDVKDDTSDEDISFEGLMSHLPLTKERVELSNNKIQVALFKIGEAFQNKLEEYFPAAENFHSLLSRFDTFKTKETALFNLYYCYNKLGLKVQADSVLNVLKTNFSDGDLIRVIEKKNNTPEKEKNESATKLYESIYNLFIEGKFEEAKAMKAKADNQFGKTYWTPQLLFIESVYYIKQREDSTAISKLREIIKLAPSTPLAAKATNMIDVLKRRKEIEKYLTDLSVERADESVTKMVDLNSPTTENKKVEAKKTDITKNNDAVKTMDKKVDAKSIVATTSKTFTFVSADTQYVMVSLEKIDRTFINEAKGAFAQFNREKFYNLKLNIGVQNLNDDYALLLIGPFENAGKAVDYSDKAKPAAASRIIPWIPAAKYNFSIISNANLELLKANKEIINYINFIKQTLPGKF